MSSKLATLQVQSVAAFQLISTNNISHAVRAGQALAHVQTIDQKPTLN